MKELLLKEKPFQHFTFKLIFAVLIIIISSKINFAQTLQSDFPVTNGSVTAMLQDGETLYLGGRFN